MKMCYAADDRRAMLVRRVSPDMLVIKLKTQFQISKSDGFWMTSRTGAR